MQIAIEGLDGVGKTTTAKKLAEKLKGVYFSKAFHLMQDTSGSYDNFTLLKECQKIESDYGIRSSVIYSKFMSYDIVTERYLCTNYAANPYLNTLESILLNIQIFGKPDLTFILYCDYETNYKRMYGRNPNDKDFVKLKTQKQFYDYLLKVANLFNLNYIFVDTTLMRLEEVITNIYDFVIKYKKNINKISNLYTIKNDKLIFNGNINEFFDSINNPSIDEIKEIQIPKNLQKISWNIFDNFKNLESINVSKDNPVFSSIDGILFDKNQEIIIRMPINYKKIDYVIPEKNKIINFNTFKNCKIRSVKLNHNCEEIGYMSFWNCHNLETVYFNDKLNKIGKNTFIGCNNIKEIYTNGTKYNWTNNILFENNERLLFYLNNNLDSIDLNCSEIAAWGFAQNSQIRNICFGKALKRLGPYSFTDSNIEQLVFSSSVKIEDCAFWNCNKLKSLIFINDVPPKLARNLFYGIKNKIIIKVPINSINSYKIAFANYLNNIEIYGEIFNDRD